MSEARVYRLEISYPEGTDAPGWRPALWDDPQYLRALTRERRRELRKLEFRWPRERMFLSSSGAYGRALLLQSLGCQVTVRRSDPVTWPDDWERGDTAAGWWPELDDDAAREEERAGSHAAWLEMVDRGLPSFREYDDLCVKAEAPDVQDR